MAGLVGLLVLAAVSCANAGEALDSSQVKLGMSPVTRVVELLQGMTARMEADGKAEEDLYENFVCWATSIISQKTKSNTAAQSRVDYLAQYISDLNGGKIELTTERVDLEKEIETLTGDLEIANQVRTKEQNDFNVAKAEMDAAIDALTKAIDVLRTATAGHEQGVLMSLKGALSEGSEARAREAAALTQAVDLGSRVLTKGDSVFLRRLLTGQVPDRANWKTLNRKATFKMGYKARSFKIQGVLAKLLETFSSNLQEAAEKERKAIEEFNTLTGAKQAEKNAAESALSKMEKENAARQLSLTDATDEKNALSTQITDDTGYIAQVKQALADKKAAWKVRQTLRTGEIAAITKAISILHSDDARDVMKKSFASQGFFLQEGAKQHSQLSDQALRTLRAAAWRSHDSRLSELLARASNSSHFVEVIQAVDSMLTVLRSEEQTDLQQKEKCETDLAADTRSAIVASRTMDELSDTITALESKVAELSAEIDDKEAQVVAINQELNETADERARENAEFLVSKADDEKARELITNAKGVLATFYSENGLTVLLAKGQHQAKAPFESVAGEAPPPPPKTWEAPYGGKTQETSGILAILDMIHSDIGGDMQKAADEESASLALYTKTKTNLEGERTGLNTAIGELTLAKNTADGDITTNIGSRNLKKGELATVIDKINAAKKGCDFITINFKVRSTNRQIEIDGLEKAKAILSGGRFDALPDPNRELKPGDAAAFAQQSRSKFLRGRE